MEEEEIEEGGPELGRRSFLGKASVGVAGLAASSAILAACGSATDGASGEADGGDDGGDGGETESDDGGSTDDAPTDDDIIEASQDAPEIEWDMATSWPTALVTLFGSAEFFAEQVSRLTNGRFRITPRPGGELTPPLEVLQGVRDGGAQAGHTASYYYTGISPVQQFGTAVPFGLNQRQQNAWLYAGGGLEILNDFYASEHGTISFPAGSTGCQMGGWFSSEINTVADIEGLTMRIPGIAGQVLTNLGGEQVSLPGGEILQAIQTGAIDAAEFVGPTDDLILGLNEFDGDLFYYHPGWWEPGTALEVQFPLSEWDNLPEQYQAAVEAAAVYANLNSLARYDISNPADLQTIQEFAEIREFSEEIMSAFKTETESVLDTIAEGDARFAEILGPWREYRDSVSEWHGLAERSYLNQQTQI